MTIETNRTYIPFETHANGSKSWCSDPTSFIGVYRRANERELRNLRLEVRFCQVPNNEGELVLFMERRIGYTCGPIPYKNLPDINLGRFGTISKIKHVHIDDMHSKVTAYLAGCDEEVSVWSEVQNHTDKEIAAYMAETGQFLISRALSTLTAA